MLIIGAKGFAKEVLEILHQNGETENLCFYDDISEDFLELLYGSFKVLKSEEEAQEYLKSTDNQFTIGIGNPKLREKLFVKFQNLGGKLTSTISRNSEIGSFGITIGEGSNILGGVKISNDVKIGKGAIIYYNSIITHDVEIGDFAEISPGATLLGRSKIGDFTQIGAGAIIFPDIIIGKNTIIGAGSVVRENVPDNCIAAGVPSKIIKKK